MKPSLLLRWLVVLTGVIAFRGQAQTRIPRSPTVANPPTEAALATVTAGKRAMVLVDTWGSAGSGFCIHSSGIFVTAAHVVEGYSQVRVVVYPGEATQRLITARVAHRDKDADLAVLVADIALEIQAPGLPPLTALPMGDSNALSENTPVTVFGFPNGTRLDSPGRELSAALSTTGSVTALRKVAGQLKAIQLDLPTNSINSGGPVLNERGQFVGVVTTGTDGAQGLYRAVPLQTLRDMLAVPEILFNPPIVAWPNRFTPVKWPILIMPVTQFSPGIAPPQGDFEITFEVNQDGTWQERKVVKVSGQGNALTTFRLEDLLLGQSRIIVNALSYRITLRQHAKVLAVREGELKFTRVPTRGGGFGDGAGGNSFPRERGGDGPTVQYPANGHWYRVVNNGRSLSWTEAKTAAEALTHAGFKGHLATITSAAEQQFILSHAMTGQLMGPNKPWIGAMQKEDAAEPAGGWRWITGEPWGFTNWSAGEPNDAGNEDWLQMGFDGGWNDAIDSNSFNSGSSFVVEFESPTGIPTVAQPVDAPQIVDDKTLINLPSPATTSVAGGGGRFVLLYLKAEQKVAVFDAQEKKIVRYIPAPGGNVLLAASQEKLVLLLTDQNILQRWNIPTGEREQSIPLPDDKAITSIAMGAASKGPLLLIRGNEPSFLDLTTLKALETLDAETGKSPTLPIANGGNAIASPDGSTFGVTGDGWMSGLWILTREGNRLSKSSIANASQNALPSFDGRWWFTSAGIFTSEGKPVVAEQLREGGPINSYQTLIPAYSTAYFVALKNNSAGSPMFNRNPRLNVTVYSANDRRELATLGAFDELGASLRLGNFNRTQGLPLEKRVYYLPERNLLVTINDGADELVIRRVDLKSAMSQDGNKFLFVASTPPRKAAKGALFTYQLDVQSQSGGLKYNVESAPPGVSITPKGLIQWKVPADFTDEEATVLVAIRDNSGQEIYHSFKIQIK